ncbi:drug resistance transporter, EmrB/QacA subfamily [Actinopolyspora xinjiangensis]|uniref:Drug resistance transporter, EmrB/QacA subfamily n=1 Tax=Actinopolyspora xinjiangensis TaxID=405564 RepID=A0A1H0Q2Y8_9ACTN|nr:DHA2 family efflux MFS transporter permease subunit [Actinopolyspora xinjiangensis]SDP11791.1 drug resistance transporter, EmrB/QacA subfamily [Actinopolyspora xinjiangensis]
MIQQKAGAVEAPAKLDDGTRRLIVVLLAGAVLPLLDTTVINVALDRLARVFDAPVSTVQWVVTAYAMATAIAIPLSAWAIKRFGGKQMWLASLSLFLAGSVLCGIAPNAGSMIAFRVLQGLGGGMSMPVLQTLLVTSAGQRQARRAMAAIGFPTVIAPVVGPVIGGAIMNGLSWRWVFFVNVPVCLLALGLAVKGVPATTPEPRSRLDSTGLLLLTGGFAALVYALTSAASPGDLTSWSFALSALGGVALLVAFTVHAIRTRYEPVADVRLFAIPSFAAATVAMLLSGIIFYGGLILLPLYYQRIVDYSVLGAGGMLALQGVGALLARSAAGRVAERVGSRGMVLGGLVAATVGTVLFSLVEPTDQPWLTAALVLRGAGIGIVTVTVLGAAYRDVPAASVAHASSLGRIMLQLGSALGAATMTTALAWQHATAPAGSPPMDDFRATFWWLSVATVLTALPSLWLPGRSRE